MASDPKDTNTFSLTMLQQVIDYIEKNLLGELTPAVIATHFFVSASSLSSLFKTVRFLFLIKPLSGMKEE